MDSMGFSSSWELNDLAWNSENLDALHLSPFMIVFYANDGQFSDSVYFLEHDL